MNAPALTTAASPRTSRGWDGILASIGAAFESYWHRKSRMDQIAKLNALSDEELAKRGLRREDIPRHVFRDLFYV